MADPENIRAARLFGWNIDDFELAQRIGIDPRAIRENRLIAEVAAGAL